MGGMAYKRKQREKHIRRKEQILRKHRLDNPPHKYNDKDLFGRVNLFQQQEIRSEGRWFPYWFVKSRGYLSKGRIHCSCGMCSAKTRNKGRRQRVSKNYAPAVNYKIRDLRRI